MATKYCWIYKLKPAFAICYIRHFESTLSCAHRAQRLIRYMCIIRCPLHKRTSTLTILNALITRVHSLNDDYLMN